MATVTLGNNSTDYVGRKRRIEFTYTFDSSYASGGESLTAADLGMNTIDGIVIQPKNGISFEYDSTNSKLKAIMVEAPPVVFSEEVTVTSNIGYLKYPAAHIINIAANNATPVAYYPVIGGITPVTTQCSVDKGWNYTTGVFTRGQRCKLTFAAADTVTTVRVSYVTQSWKSVVDNMVLAKLTAGARVYGHASLAFTAGTPDSIDLGEAAVAIGDITHYTGTAYQETKALYKGETAAAKEAAIDWSNSTNTTLAVLQTQVWDDAGHSVYIEYIKKPASGMLSDNFVEEDDCTPSSDVITLANVSPLLFGTIGQLCGATTKAMQIVWNGSTIGSTATYIQLTRHMFLKTSTTWGACTMTAGSSHADTDHIKPSYVYGDIGQIARLPVEVPNGDDLSWLSVKGVGYGA